MTVLVHRIPKEQLKELNDIDLFDRLFSITFNTVKDLLNVMQQDTERHLSGRPYRISGLRNIRMLTLNLRDLANIFRKKSLVRSKTIQAERNEKTRLSNIERKNKNRVSEKQVISTGKSVKKSPSKTKGKL